MKKRPRANIDPSVLTSVLTKSRRRCCLCYFLDDDKTEKKGQVAHLDNDRANPNEDNLAWLCFDHHSDYDSVSSQHKNYTIHEVKSYRNRLYGIFDVVQEAGYRCAVCGKPFPLELAHIVPLKQTQHHSEANLICLCANCAERASKDNRWNLEEYKREPWVVRDFKGPIGVESRTKVEVRIRMEMTDFDDKQRKMLLYALAGFLDISADNIEFGRESEGSVIVRLGLPSSHSERLISASIANDPLLIELLGEFPLLDSRVIQASRVFNSRVLTRVLGVVVGTGLFGLLEALYRPSSANLTFGTPLFGMLAGLFGLGMFETVRWYRHEMRAARTTNKQKIERPLIGDYVVSALPTVGFIGTVLGISHALASSSLIVKSASKAAFEEITQLLGFAFSITFVAMVFSLIVSLSLSMAVWRIRKVLEQKITKEF